MVSTKLGVRIAYGLSRSLRGAQRPQYFRTFSCSTIRKIDGVYEALTRVRIERPYLEALHERDEKLKRGESTGALPASAPVSNPAPKTMGESFHKVILPLALDPWLLDNYVNAAGQIRLGSIFMDLDAMAGIVAYKHTGDSVMTVTAAVDRILIRNPLKKVCNIELSGQVTFATGRSSMEITLQAAKAAEDGERPKSEDVLLTCTFTMVSLNPTTKKPTNIPALRLETDEERRIFKLGEQNYELKKASSGLGLRKTAPTRAESELIHNLWLQELAVKDPNSELKKPVNTKYMSKTRIHTSLIMQPQYRNRHSFMIFGGYLLKQTFEQAFLCASSFSKTKPVFVSLDPSTFENPVPVGSVLHLNSQVAFTESVASDKGADSTTRVQVRVDTSVRIVETGETKPTGQFNYTFLIDKDIHVTPQSYLDFMIWIDARRRAERTREALALEKSSADVTMSPVTMDGPRLTE